MSTEKGGEETRKAAGGLVLAGQGIDLALRNAVRLRADSTTDAASAFRADLLRSKYRIVCSFFTGLGKHPAEVTPLDVKAWRDKLEERHKQATVYSRVSRPSSFYEWAMRDPQLAGLIEKNPVRLARPKAPKAYQTESVKSLDEEQVSKLLKTVVERAAAGDIVGKRDCALLLLFITTGMRRQEVIGLKGSDVELRKDDLIIKCRIKGGDYVARSVEEPSVREAILDYLNSCDRLNALSSERPLWTRHDRAGKPGAPLTSHAFAKNLKRYAEAAGIRQIHIHQTRHTFARMVAEETGSLVETQEALGHKNLATTRAYVRRVAVRRDKHSRRIAERLKADG